MKSKIVFCMLLLFLSILNVNAKPINNNFADDNFYNCVIEAYNEENKTNYSKSYNLTNEELLKITKLDCYNYYKKDEEKIVITKGLEKLKNLTYLNLELNNVSNIDVSENTKLTYLNLRKNNLNAARVLSWQHFFIF